MSVFRRIGSGTAANVLNLAYVTAVTAATVPVLVHAWGVETYGVWVMLTAIPTYLALSDLGFSTAATNDMAMSVARGDEQRANEALHSIWMLSLVTAAAVVAVSVIVATSAIVSGLRLELCIALGVLGMYSAACMLSRTLLGVFRGSGRYTQGTLVYDGAQFIEGLACLAAAASGLGLAGAASALLAVRIVNVAALFVLLMRDGGPVVLGTQGASFARLKSLLPAALASMSVPISLALNMQGVALVLGVLVSPQATAVLSAARTVSRVAVQVLSAANRAMVPELSAASGRQSDAERQRILRLNRSLLLAIVLPSAVAFVAFGSSAISAWTLGQIHPSHWVLFWLGAAMAAHCVWYFGTNILSATNEHGRMAAALIVASGLAVAVAFVLSPIFGVEGAAFAVFAGEGMALIWYWTVTQRRRVGPEDRGGGGASGSESVRALTEG